MLRILYAYNKGVMREISIDKLKNELNKRKIKKLNDIGNRVWIDVFNPTEKELDILVDITTIPKYEYKICLDPDERPRVEVNEEYDYNLIIFKSPHVGKDYIDTTTTGFFFKKNYLVTIHSEKVSSIRDLFQEFKNKRIEQDLERLICSLFGLSLKNYESIIDNLEESVDKLEEAIFKTNQIDFEIFLDMKETLIYFRKALVSNRDMFNTIISKNYVKFSKTNLDLIDDLKNEIEQLIEAEDILRERLTSSLEIYLSLSSNRLNETMKVMTLLATLFIVPTLISSIYGMNFKYMPLINHPYGFWYSIGIMLIGMVLLLLYFRKI